MTSPINSASPRQKVREQDLRVDENIEEEVNNSVSTQAVFRGFAERVVSNIIPQKQQQRLATFSVFSPKGNTANDQSHLDQISRGAIMAEAAGNGLGLLSQSYISNIQGQGPGPFVEQSSRSFVQGSSYQAAVRQREEAVQRGVFFRYTHYLARSSWMYVAFVTILLVC